MTTTAIPDLTAELTARIEAAADRLRIEFTTQRYVDTRALAAVTEALDILEGHPDGADE